MNICLIFAVSIASWCFARCTYEIFCGHDTGALVEVAMTHAEYVSFIDTIKVNYGAVNRMLAVVDVRNTNWNSECWNPDDKRRIFEAVERGAGFEAISAAVMTEMRGCLVAMVDRALGEVPATAGVDFEEEMSRLQHLKGRLLRHHGQYIGVELAFAECLSFRRVYFGPEHVNTLDTFPSSFTLQGPRSLSRGRTASRRFLAKQRRVLSEDDLNNNFCSE